MAAGVIELAGMIARARLRATRRGIASEQLTVLMIKAATGLGCAAIGTWWALTAPIAETPALVRVIGAGWLLVWLVVPLVTGGGGEVITAEQLGHLPHPAGRLARALLLSQLAGGAPVLITAGSTPVLVLGVRYAGAALVLAVPVWLATALLVFAASRLLLNGLGTLLRGAAGRSLGAAVLVVLAISVAVGVRSVTGAVQSAGLGASLTSVDRVVRFLPTGLPVAVLTAARRGEWGMVVLTAAGLAVTLLVLVLALEWVTGDRIAHHRPVDTSPRPGATGVLRFWRLVPDKPATAAARSESALWLRDPRRRATVAMSAVVLPGVIGPALDGWTVLLPFAGLAVIAYLGAEVCNLYGLEPRSLFAAMTIPGGIGADVRGKQLSWLWLVTPFAVTSTVGGVAIDGDGGRAVWALALLPAVLGATAGLLALLSVVAAARVPDEAANPFTLNLNPHHGQLLYTPLLVLALLPVLLPLGASLVFGQPLVALLALPAGILFGPVAQRVARRRAERHLTDAGDRVLGSVW